MKAQKKGIQTLAKLCGVSTLTVVNARDGKNVNTDTLSAIAHELGYKLVLVRDETIEQTVFHRKPKRCKKVFVEPASGKKPSVPQKRKYERKTQK